MTYSTKRRRLSAAALAGTLSLTLGLSACSAEAGPVEYGEMVSTSSGEYLQTTISKADPAWAVPDEVVLPEVREKYSDRQIRKAYRTALKFAAEEGIDSPLNGEGQSVADWWSEHEDSFHPEHRDEILAGLEQGDSVVQREPWQEEIHGYSYIYDSSPRVTERSLIPDAIWLAEDGSIEVRLDVRYTMSVVPEVGEDGSGRQITDGMMTYTVRDEGWGRWGIAGFMHDLETFPG